MEIFHDTNDYWACNNLLYHLNDSSKPLNWKRDLKQSNVSVFGRPDHWQEREPLVLVLCYCIHSNHIHLLLKEIKEDGISKFMQGLPNSLSQRYNKKYGGSGSIFQGPYQSRHIETDADLHNVALYIMAKNVMERFPGGISSAAQNFDGAWKWAVEDNFSSFPDYGANRNSPITEKEVLGDHFPVPARFKNEVSDYISNYIERERELGTLALD
ncbi:MAG: transposase [Candidatus Paceibacterota bacterium]